MFERFTDRARRVIVFAQEDARDLNHTYIGTEHILLGLIHEGEGVAAKALGALDISLEAVRQQVEEIIGPGHAPAMGHIPFTPRAKTVLHLSFREALQLRHNYIGTEHILLGLIREGEGVAAQVLQKLGADLNRVRQTVIQLLSGYPQGVAPEHAEEAKGEAARGTQATVGTVSQLRSTVSTDDFPTCPSCAAPLGEWLAVKEVFARAPDDQVAAVMIAFCGRCGATIGPVSA